MDRPEIPVRNIFNAKLFAILQAALTIRDKAAGMIIEEVQKAMVFTGSQAALNHIQYNGIGPGQTWASAIIRNTEDIGK
jgi:hypothetical protein